MRAVGIVGIGAMGSGIAKNWLKAGFAVTAYARDTSGGRAAGAALAEAGATVVHDLGDLFRAVDTLALCVPASADVEAILAGDGSAAGGTAAGGLLGCEGARVRTVLDFSTSHPASTLKMAEKLAERGIGMLDTPMTGSVGEAANATLKLVVGGDRDLYERNLDLLRAVSDMSLYAGGHGAGNMVKLANNYLSILDQTVTAAVSLILEKNGIPRDVYVKFLENSSANSGGFRLMMRRITSGDFSTKFELGLATKDIGYCRDIFDLPITGDLHGILRAACDSGYRDGDVGLVYRHLEASLK